eukprot:3580117-Rhodomonas_salina.2
MTLTNRASRKALSMNPDNAGAIHGLASILGGDAVPDVAPAESYTLDPTPCTLRHRPYTLHPKP